MATLSRTRRPVKVNPVSGSCRWLRPLVINGQTGRLRITSHTQRGPVTAVYDVSAHMEGPNVIGYRLAKIEGTREVYDIDTTGEHWICDCRDWLTRRDPSLGLDSSHRGCKHCCAIRAGKGKILRLI